MARKHDIVYSIHDMRDFDALMVPLLGDAMKYVFSDVGIILLAVVLGVTLLAA